MNFFNVKSKDEGLEIIDKLATEIDLGTEIVDLLNCKNRVLSKDIYANFPLPEYTRSVVDGYGCKIRDLANIDKNNPAQLELAGKVKMGEVYDKELEHGQAVYIPTGGNVPKGVETIVMVEYSENLFGKILLYKESAVHSYMVGIGEDMKKDEKILTKGTKIDAYNIGLLAAQGINEIEVYKAPKVVLFSTGDEIVSAGESKLAGEKYDINGYVINEFLQESGCYVIEKYIVKDDKDELKRLLSKSLEEADVIFLSGGSSVGEKDFTYDIVNELTDKIHINGLAVKPGKPTLVASKGNKTIIGLPGHVTSSILVYKIFFEKFIYEIQKKEYKCKKVKGVLTDTLYNNAGRELHQIVNVFDNDNIVLVTPIVGKSNMISTLSRANGYVTVGRDEKLIEKGKNVEVILIK